MMRWLAGLEKEQDKSDIQMLPRPKLKDSQGFPFCFFRQVTVTPHDDLLFLPSCKKQVQSKWRSCELIHTGSSKRAHQSERGDLFSGKISARGAELGVVKWSKTKKNR